MKKIVWLLCWVIAAGSVRAQRPLDVSYTLDRQGVYNFTCMNRTLSPYVLRVVFSSLENGKTDHELPFEAEVRPGMNSLFKMSKLKAAEDIVFKYSISFHKGCKQTSAKADFPYLLPIAAGKTTQAYVTGDSTGGLYAVRMRMKPGDTIYASRRGIVTMIDAGSSQNDAGVTSTEGWNAIEIWQGDCTFAQYGVIKKDGALVKPGQMVEAGMPIGLVGGDQFGRGSEARLSVYYYEGNAPAYVPLHFWTKKYGKTLLKHGGEYTSEQTQEILQLEIKRTAVKAASGRKPAVKKTH